MPRAVAVNALTPCDPEPGLDGRIVVSGLTKTYDRLAAVRDVSFTVEPGRVTGFLGPNGAGKTTTLRMLLGLVVPDSGTATIGGRRYADLVEPLRSVGAVLESTGAHPDRTGRNHLRIVCDVAGMALGRADEVLDLTGLVPAANRPVRAYSLGMRQRLAIAAAMVGDPRVLILDEPANGLDPEGIAWMRAFLRNLAADGRTVVVSSHVLAEMEVLADDLVIIAAGSLVAQGTVEHVIDSSPVGVVVHVRTPDPGALSAAILERGGTATPAADGRLRITGLPVASVDAAAGAIGAEIYDLATGRADLEDVFLDLTRGKATIR
jgi:ABC-2 type transport system ATP-binding protein